MTHHELDGTTILDDDEFQDHLEQGFENSDPTDVVEYPDGAKLETWDNGMGSHLYRYTNAQGVVVYAHDVLEES